MAFFAAPNGPGTDGGHPRALNVAFLCLLASFASPVAAQDAHFHAPKKPRNVIGGCNDAPLGQLKAVLPFGPAEELHYDVRAVGMRTGKVRVRVGALRTVGNRQVFAITAKAKNHGVFSILNPFSARVTTILDPHTTKPTRLHGLTTFEDGNWVRERAQFFAGGRVHSTLEASQGRSRKGRLKATSDVVDVVSLVYYARNRALLDDQRFCLEVYHRRHLWRIEGRVGQKEVLSVPATSRMAHRIDATVRRLGGKAKKPPRRVTAWISADRDRLPLRVKSPGKVGAVEMVLIRHRPGRRFVAAGAKMP